MNPRWYMRPDGPHEEQLERDRVGGLIDRWWGSFVSRHSDLDALFSRNQSWDLPSWMGDTLQAICSDLMWEFGPGPNGGHRLVITPEHQLELRPLVEEILRRAPSLDGWSFHGHRLREVFATAAATVEARSGAPLQARGYQLKKSRYNLIDVSIQFPRSVLRNDPDLANAQSFVLLESLLGEAVLNESVGAIEVEPKGWRSGSLERLAVEFDQLVLDMRRSLPSTPLCSLADEAMWTLFKLEPEPADDYTSQTDMFVGKSLNAQLWENAHTAVPFYSRRYSDVGEVFCYLKMDGSDGLDEEKFEDKGDIEDALDECLRADALGCFVGGGTGLRYSYIDLAITDIRRAVPVIRRVLQAGKLTKRAWIQFFDSELQYEWVGVWPDSPPPPGMLL